MMKYYYLFLSLTLSVVCNGQVKIIGHRGSSYEAPENTISSSKLAWKENADAVETDVYLSKDMKIIVSHDLSTKRITGEDYDISQTSSRVLRKLDAGSFKGADYKGEKLPFLKELIGLTPAGRELVVEIKCGDEIIPFLRKDIKKYGPGKKITFICFDLNTITEIRKAFPYFDCYWLCSDRDLLVRNLEKVKQAGINGVSLDWRIIDADIVKQITDMSLEVYSWTVDSEKEAVRLVSLGIKGITTNRPGWMKEQLGIGQ